MHKKIVQIQTEIEEKEKLLTDFITKINAPSLRPIIESIDKAKDEIDDLKNSMDQLKISTEASILSIQKNIEKNMKTSMDTLDQTLERKIPEHVFQNLSEQQRHLKTTLDTHQKDTRAICAANRAATLAKLQAGFAKTGAALSTQTLAADNLSKQVCTYQDATHARLIQQRTALEQQLGRCQFWGKCQAIITSIFFIGMTVYMVWQQWSA